MNRKAFFDGAREMLGGALKSSQVEGLQLILDEWAKSGWHDLRWLSYMLATTQHETARTFRPIREYGLGKGKKYGQPDQITGEAYYGRGFVQLTWKENYAKAAARLGVELVYHPDRAMEPGVAVRILFSGMNEGWFAGDAQGRHTLARYFNDRTGDPVAARRIINGTDKAAQIAAIHDGWHEILKGCA